MEPTLCYSGRILRRFNEIEWERCPYIGLISDKKYQEIKNDLSKLIERILEFDYGTNEYKKRFIHYANKTKFTKLTHHIMRN